jgi:hypothetical protein
MEVLQSPHLTSKLVLRVLQVLQLALQSLDVLAVRLEIREQLLNLLLQHRNAVL